MLHWLAVHSRNCGYFCFPSITTCSSWVALTLTGGAREIDACSNMDHNHAPKEVVAMPGDLVHVKPRLTFSHFSTHRQHALEDCSLHEGVGVRV